MKACESVLININTMHFKTCLNSSGNSTITRLKCECYYLLKHSIRLSHNYKTCSARVLVSIINLEYH